MERAKIDLISEKWALWASLLFWTGVYSVGRHPDVTWGDGIGFALSIRHGFDLSVNANSHFLYLNFHRLCMSLFGFNDSMQVLSWASVVWSVATLWVVYAIGKTLDLPKAGLISLHLLASCFPFWRHACVIEVYAMELFFWALCIWGLVLWLHRNGERAIWLVFVAQAIGLLVHIHLVLLFPVLLFAFWLKKEFRPIWFLPYAVPLLVFGYAVYGSEVNTINEIFFDSIQGEMLHFSGTRLVTGAALTMGLVAFLFPTGAGLLFWLCWKGRGHFKPFFQASIVKVLGALALVLAAFCVPYPAFGIYVFLLPIFLLLALAAGFIWMKAFGSQTAFILPIVLILIFQCIFFVSLKQLSALIAPSSLHPTLEAKGGWGYYCYPWARGNAPSVLEATQKGLVPADLEWNAIQARMWLKESHPTDSKLPTDKGL